MNECANLSRVFLGSAVTTAAQTAVPTAGKGRRIRKVGLNAAVLNAVVLITDAQPAMLRDTEISN